MSGQVGDLIYDGETWGLIKEKKHEDTFPLYVIEWYTNNTTMIDWYTDLHVTRWRKQAVDSGATR